MSHDNSGQTSLAGRVRPVQCRRRSLGLERAPWLRIGLAVLALSALAQAPLLIGAPALALSLPLEPLAAALLLLALPPGRARWVVWPLAALLTAACLVLAMERTAFTLLGRPLKLWLDLQLVQPALELISGSMSLSIAVSVALLLLVLPPLVFWVFWRLCRSLEAASAPRLAIAGAAVALTGMAAAPQAPKLTASFLYDALAFQAERSLRVAQERPLFEADLAEDPLAGLADGLQATDPLAGLAGADVVLVFVESYGQAALTDPRYAPRLLETLGEIEADLNAAGLAQASGWLRSPTRGGQSWLAHASLASGLWIDTQDRWDLLVSSERRLLTHVFAAAGYETALVMPAIVRAWPEAEFFAFDRHYFRDDMGYAGPPYAWVTMPDQYTLAVLDREVLAESGHAGTGRPPIFAQVALISSHAPWTPIPPVIDDWSAIGDGALFTAWAEPPIPPRELWLDGDAVRAAYVEALDYVLRTLGSWLRQPWERPRLVLIVGDHEAGAVVSGPGTRSVVPVHVVGDRPELVLRLAQAGLAEGLLPPAEQNDSLPPLMSDFRSLFLDAFAAPAELFPTGDVRPGEAAPGS